MPCDAVDEEMILAVDACSASLKAQATATARGLGPTIPVALHERLKGKFPAKSAAGAWFAGVDASVKGLNGEIDVDELLLLFEARFHNRSRAVKLLMYRKMHLKMS